ncbi:hypothetical protein [Streptococcus dentiloxodontae]
MMITDQDYRYIADISYWVDSGKKEKLFTPKEETIINSIDIKGLSQSYQIISELANNTNNGMQAMAVAPVVNGKADTSEIILAYAGTNFKDKRDVDTDLQM